MVSDHLVMAFYNHKGGVGKTTLAVHLAYALGKAGASVLLIDVDPQGSACRWISGYEGVFDNGIAWDLVGMMVQVVFAPHANDQRLKEIIKEKSLKDTIVIIDCPPAREVPSSLAAVPNLWVLPVRGRLSISGALEAKGEIEERLRLVSDFGGDLSSVKVALLPNMTDARRGWSTKDRKSAEAIGADMIWPEIPACEGVIMAEEMGSVVFKTPYGGSRKSAVAFVKLAKQIKKDWKKWLCKPKRGKSSLARLKS